MAAMRLASEQQLARDCLNGVGSSDRHDVGNSPSIESLMTLLWATNVFERERQRTPKMDVSTEVRQACSELDNLFVTREVAGVRRVSLVEAGLESRQKSLDGWRMARP